MVLARHLQARMCGNALIPAIPAYAASGVTIFGATYRKFMPEIAQLGLITKNLTRHSHLHQNPDKALKSKQKRRSWVGGGKSTTQLLTVTALQSVFSNIEVVWGYWLIGWSVHGFGLRLCSANCDDQKILLCKKKCDRSLIRFCRPF